MTAELNTEVFLAAPRQSPAVESPSPLCLASPQLSVAIVNYCQWRNTAKLVRQLRDSRAMRGGAAEVVVVDNHSPYRPIRKKLRRMPGVSLRCLRQNRGFGRGANEACRLSRGRWFLLLNPDVTVPPGFLDRALAQIDRMEREDPTAGIVGLQLRDPNGAIQGSAGVVPTFLGTLLGMLRPRAERKCRPLAARGRMKVPWVTGCGLLVRRDCFEALGGFDPDYFLYYEDADLCRRGRAAGWTVWHDPALHIVHHSPLHTRSVPSRIRLLTRHALLTFARKNWPAWQFVLLGCLVWMEAIARGQRTVRRMALDLILGRKQRAQYRVRRAAQFGNRAQEGLRVESKKGIRRGGHERRPLPR